jgi:hypothetical protein
MKRPAISFSAEANSDEWTVKVGDKSTKITESDVATGEHVTWINTQLAHYGATR